MTVGAASSTTPRKDDGRYMVVGPPRGGFTLLLSVLAILYRDRGKRKPAAQEIADPYIGIAGEYLDTAIREHFSHEVGADDFFYNREFSILVGGPKWITDDDPDTVCVRKYLGIAGRGDFTFLLYLPRWVLASDDILHSHSHPARWLDVADYSAHRKLASIRNPIDIIHSSVFSINALASEYIHRRMHMRDDDIRRELALNKLSNPAFISGLITFLARYLDEFLRVADRYDYVMRWETLIMSPVDEIRRIADAVGEPVDNETAARIWAELDHRNLTRYHRHSFRVGVLNDWERNLTNTHMTLFEKAGFGHYLEALGYPPIHRFDELAYTPDQHLIEAHISADRPYVEKLDPDVIRFAFNKTNFVASGRFAYRHFPRQGAIEIEKSTLDDDALATRFMGAMAGVTDTVYRYLSRLGPAAAEASRGDRSKLGRLQEEFAPLFGAVLGDRADALFQQVEGIVPQPPAPRLMGNLHGYNIVLVDKQYLSVPQSLGPMDLSQVDRSNLPAGILVTASYDEAVRAISEAVER